MDYYKRILSANVLTMLIWGCSSEDEPIDSIPWAYIYHPSQSKVAHQEMIDLFQL